MRARDVRYPILARLLVLLPLVATLLPPAPAGAEPVALLGGRTARFRAFLVPKRNSAVITVSADPALEPLLDPIACPADPTLRIRASDGFDTGEIVLPCAAWKRAGTGYRYVDKQAAISGVHTVVYAKRRLSVRLKGESYPALVGPIVPPASIEVSFGTGARDYCARFTTFRRNEAGLVHAVKPSVACLAPTPTPSPSPSPSPTPTPVPTPTPAWTCPAGSTCASFAVAPGPGDLLPIDDGASTWLRLFDFTGANVFGNATNGRFGPDPFVLALGAPDAEGLAPLELVRTTYLGASLVDAAQQLGGEGTICLEIQPDPNASGFVDCDGGTDADAALLVDSNGPLAAGPSLLSLPAGADPLAPAGAGVVRVRLRLAVAPFNDAPCSALDYSASPSIETAFTTGLATSRVDEPWMAGAPGTATNETSLAGVPFACDGFGSPDAAPVSIVAPLFALDFVAPIIEQVIDVAQVFRVQLVPGGSMTPTPAPSATPTPQPTATPSPTATPTLQPTPSPTPAPSPSPTPAPSATPTPTGPSTPTPPPVATVVPAVIDAVTIEDRSTQYGPDHTALGNCYDAARSSVAIVTQSSGAFGTRFQQSVASDCEAVPTGGGGVAAEASADYTIGFAVTCPAGSTYTLSVETTLRGAHTIHRDNFDGCDLPFFGETLASHARLSGVVGSLAGGTLAGGTLGLAAPPDLVSAPDADAPFLRAGSATITGTGTGAPMAHALRFTWDASCSSNGDSTNTGSECAVRLGLTSPLAPNGISGCMDADDYPGVGARDAASDGHFVTVTGTCTVLVAPPTPTSGATPTPAPSATPSPVPTVSPTPTPTPTPGASPTPSPGAQPLGQLAFTVAPGSSARCPADGVAGSFLKTHGNPTGGLAGTVCSGTTGAFTSGPLLLVAGVPDAFGRADLILGAPVVIGASLDTQTPNCGGSCVACWRFEDDTSALGFVDCDGGTNVDQTLIVASNGTAAPPAPSFSSSWWTLPSGGGDSGPGAAVVRVRVKRMRVNGTTTCPGVSDAAWNTIPEETLALTTGTATARIDSRRQCPGNLLGTACPSANPYTVTLSGTSFSCASWTTNGSARLVIPFVNLDESIGGSFGTGDIAQVLRLDD